MNVNEQLKKYSFLSISLLLTSAWAASGCIPAMSKAFPNQATSSIEMITTIPSLAIVVFVLCSSKIADRIGAKKTVILGLTVSLVFGLIPAFSTNYWVIILSRLGLGCGFGLFNSLAVSMIPQLFPMNEQAKLIGFQSAFQGIGSAILTFIAGLLLLINWHATFLIYLAIIPIMFMFVKFVPEPGQQNPATIPHPNSGRVFSSTLVLSMLFLFFMMVMYSSFQLKIATQLINFHIGTATQANMLISLSQIGSILGGLTFGVLFKRFSQHILLIALTSMATAYFLISQLHFIWIAALAGFLCGLSFAFFTAYLFNTVSNATSVERQTLAISFLLVAANIGQSISPIILNFWTGVFAANSSNNTFLVCAFSISIITFGVLLKNLFNHLQINKNVQTKRN